jgi:hypothetical protein
MDDAYSAKIAGLYKDANPAVQAAAYMGGGAHPSLRKAQPEVGEGAGRGERALASVLEYAIPAANAVPKYVLPAAGVTAAGHGLMEIANALQGNQQTADTLPLAMDEETFGMM